MSPLSLFRLRHAARVLTPAIALAGIATAAATPAGAQMFSASYRFLDSVRDRDGSKVTELLDSTPAIVNTRDITTGETGLLITIARRDIVWVRFLLNRDADPNLADRNGLTPMMSAAQIGFVDAVQELLAKGAQVNRTNGRGETALHVAVQRRDVALVRLLMQSGANADAQDNIAGMSPRDYAGADNRGSAVLAAMNEAPAAPPTGARPAGPN
ncbi:MAG: ankyrin repeat domain-containing protein [Sphingopyxis sp.]